VLGLGDEAVVHDAEGLGGIAERADGSPVAIEPARPGRLVPLADVVAPDAGVEVGDSHVAAGGTTVRVVDGVLQVERDGRTVDLTWVDEADAGDEYDFGAIPGDAPITAPAVATGSREAGPGVAELEVEHLLRVPRSIAADRERRSGDLVDLRVRTRVRVSAATPLAHLVVDLDNTACDHRLRLRATVDGLTASDTVEALGHFAVVERPVRPPRPASSWRQLPPGLDHCSGAVRAGGVLLAGRGIHEYEAHPGALDLTVLRSVGWLSRDDIAGRPGHAGPALATPGAQCLGPRRVELAVGVGEAAAFAQARAFLAPPLVLEPFGIGQSSSPAADPDVPYPLESGAMARVRDLRAASGDPLDARARIERFGLEVLADGAFVSACKLADDDSGDLVVRWWAPHAGDEARAELRLGEGVGVRDVQRARLDETPLGPAPLVDGRCSLRVPPGGIVTVRVRLGE
jgi:alpha-mannosidase